MRKFLVNYWARTNYHTSVITVQCFNHCAAEANIILAYASLFTIHNIIYPFNINCRKIDRQYRSWIEYLNELFKVCTFDRSIKLDNTNMFLWQKSSRETVLRAGKWRLRYNSSAICRSLCFCGLCRQLASVMN
mgnify:CR=1 FL=1